MKPGRQWLFFDADFFDNGLTLALLKRFGPAGPLLFVAFLCACKRNEIEGRISYRTEFQALELMGVADLPLVDPDSLPWSLEEFWEFTGRYKQTKRTRRGNTWHVSATHWEQWQKSRNTAYERERKRNWRAETQGRDSSNTASEQQKDSEKTAFGQTQNRRSWPRSVRDKVTPDTDTETETRDIGTRSRKNNPEPPAYQPWEPEPEPQEPIVSKDAIRSLLRRSTDVDG